MDDEIRVTRCRRATHPDQIPSMRLMRGARVTVGTTTGAVIHHTTALRGRGCGRRDGGDEISPRCPPRPDHQHVPGDRRHGLLTGPTDAVRPHTTVLRGSGCARGDGGDKKSPCYPPRQDHQHASDEGRMRD